MKLGIVIGINLGIAYSCVGVYKNDHVDTIAKDHGNRITRWWVGFTDSEKLIGEVAKNQAVVNPERTIFGMITKKMKYTAEPYFGKKNEDAVITVPAYFNDGAATADFNDAEQCMQDLGNVAKEVNNYESQHTILDSTGYLTKHRVSKHDVRNRKRRGHPRSVQSGFDGEDVSDRVKDDPTVSDDSQQSELEDDYLMRFPRRSLILQRFPELLNKSGPISVGDAKKYLDKERYKFVLKTLEADSKGKFSFSDTSGLMVIFWKPESLHRKFLSRKKTIKRLEAAAGYIRDQGFHSLCWAYTICDMISSSLVLHGWEKEYTPLCPHYLCEEADPDSYGKNVDENANKYDHQVHSCYPYNLRYGLSYVKRFGIPKEKEVAFNCNFERPYDPEEKMYHITDVFNYDTLQQALVRLKSHPVGASLILFQGWEDIGIYLGPLKKGAKYIGEHEVLMIDCRQTDAGKVVRCKSSNSEEIGRKGYIFVSIEVMVIVVGGSRKKVSNSSNTCPRKPQYLLHEFFSVGMDTGPMGLQFKEKPNRARKNLKFKMADVEYEVVEDGEDSVEDDEEIDKES